MLSFKLLQEKDLAAVYEWRRNPDVAGNMVTNGPADFKQHQQWFNKVSHSPSCIYWIISYQEKGIGVINLADIDLFQERCSWAYYIGDSEYRGLGGLIPPYLYNALFAHNEIKVLIADVLETNITVQKLHQLHGYTDCGLIEAGRDLNESASLLRRFELDASSWSKNKRFHRYKAEFDGLTSQLTALKQLPCNKVSS